MPCLWHFLKVERTVDPRPNRRVRSLRGERSGELFQAPGPAVHQARKAFVLIEPAGRVPEGGGIKGAEDELRGKEL